MLTLLTCKSLGTCFRSLWVKYIIHSINIKNLQFLYLFVLLYLKTCFYLWQHVFSGWPPTVTAHKWLPSSHGLRSYANTAELAKPYSDKTCCISLNWIPSGLQSCFQTIWSFPHIRFHWLNIIIEKLKKNSTKNDWI